MLLKRYILAAALVLFAAALISAGKKKEEPVLPSAYILVECETGTVLSEYNSAQRLNGCYMNKLMALLLIAEDINAGQYELSDVLTASESVRGTSGSVIWLEPGDQLTVEELLKSVIIGNANDALTVLAENSSGTVEDFTMDMNARAFDLGLRDTVYISPYGYYDEREYTTCADISMVCSELSEYEFLRPYFCTWRDFVKEGRTELVSENTLSRTYHRHCGFKACHSDAAGYCIAECGTNDVGLKFAAVVLGADSEDVSFGTAKRLINQGFSDYKVTAAVFPEDLLRPVTVRNGETSAVELSFAERSDVVVPRGSSSLRTVSVLPAFLDAPLTKGQRVGKAAFYNGKELVFETDIIVKNDVNKLSYGFILKEILYKLSE